MQIIASTHVEGLFVPPNQNIDRKFNPINGPLNYVSKKLTDPLLPIERGVSLITGPVSLSRAKVGGRMAD